MKNARKTRRGRSVPAPKEREPLVVEMIFPDPVGPETPSSEPPAAPRPAETGGRRPPERIVFRF